MILVRDGIFVVSSLSGKIPGVNERIGKIVARTLSIENKSVDKDGGCECADHELEERDNQNAKTQRQATKIFRAHDRRGWILWAQRWLL